MSLEFERRLAGDQKRIEEALGAIFREDDRYADLQEAMEYSLMAGGKRVRPVLTLECCRLCGGDPERALPFACGVEMVHTYSLIHDDLPCMDDDDLRRGRPTNHRVYGEATAVLAGDGLLTAAFQMLTARRDLLSPEQMAEGVDCLSRAAGPSGMVGGQVLDMAGEGRSLSLSELELLQSLKTGALISAAAELGCIAAGGSPEQRRAVARYAQKLGHAGRDGHHRGVWQAGGLGPLQREEHLRHGPGAGGEWRAGGAADGGGSVRTERIPAAGLPHLAGPGAGLPAEVKTDGTEGSEGKCLRGVPVF